MFVNFEQIERLVFCHSLSFSLLFFSLLYQRADDEALTRLLQIYLFLAASPILVMSIVFLRVPSVSFWSIQMTRSSRETVFLSLAKTKLPPKLTFTLWPKTKT